jgi:hypothetical protein
VNGGTAQILYLFRNHAIGQYDPGRVVVGATLDAIEVDGAGKEIGEPLKNVIPFYNLKNPK